MSLQIVLKGNTVPYSTGDESLPIYTGKADLDESSGPPTTNSSPPIEVELFARAQLYTSISLSTSGNVDYYYFLFSENGINYSKDLNDLSLDGSTVDTRKSIWIKAVVLNTFPITAGNKTVAKVKLIYKEQ